MKEDGNKLCNFLHDLSKAPNPSTLTLEQERPSYLDLLGKIPQITPHVFHRGTCLYKTGKCQAERALKSNGNVHNLCELHRDKQNQSQRRLDAKNRVKMTSSRHSPYLRQELSRGSLSSEITYFPMTTGSRSQGSNPQEAGTRLSDVIAPCDFDNTSWRKLLSVRGQQMYETEVEEANKYYKQELIQTLVRELKDENSFCDNDTLIHEQLHCPDTAILPSATSPARLMSFQNLNSASSTSL